MSDERETPLDLTDNLPVVRTLTVDDVSGIVEELAA
jgi:hypothetical protein